MIHLPRNLIRRVRAVLRKLVFATLDASQPVRVEAQADGLRVRALLPEVAAEFFQEGDFGSGATILRASQLKDWEGGKDDCISITPLSAEKATAEWMIDGIPQAAEWDPPKDDRPFPAPAAVLQGMRGSFLDALKQAAPCCAKDLVRYALNCFVLDGAKGRIVATDREQLIVLNGWEFPWENDVFLPALRVFAGNDLESNQVEMGKSDTHLTMRVGPWTFHFSIDADRRYPAIDQVIPDREKQTTTWVLDKLDADFLVRTLPHLPSREDNRDAVTLDLGAEVLIRAKADNSDQVTEIVLPRSRVDGLPLCMSVSREKLSRAAQLGFEAFFLTKADAIVLNQDEQKTFVWLPFAPTLAIPSQPNPRRIEAGTVGSGAAKSTANGNATASGTGNGNGRLSSPNGHGNGQVGQPALAKKRKVRRSPNGSGSLLEETVKLRGQARDLAAGLNNMIRALKQQRRQSRLMESTLSSLKNLKSLVS